MTLRLTLSGIIAASAMLLSGCANSGSPASPQAASDRASQDCFFLSQVSGFTDAGRDKINVSVGPRRTYEFQTFGSCPQLDYSNAIAFDQKGPGTICRSMDVDLIVPTSIGPQRCPVSMIRRLPEKP
jgi:Family of unknown function (DUF6491)